MLPRLISWAFLCQSMVKKDRKKSCLPEGVVRKLFLHRYKKRKKFAGKNFSYPPPRGSVPNFVVKRQRSWHFGRWPLVIALGPVVQSSVTQILDKLKF